MDKLRRNIDEINKCIERAAVKSGRKMSDITLVAVSKTVDADIVRLAYQLGIENFGENRVQELKKKTDNIPQAKFHMIGRLQTNKVKEIFDRVYLIHSLDRWKLAEELDKRGQHAGIEVPVLLQVNISQEEQKAGIEAGEVADFLDSAGQLKALRIWGLMTIAPLANNEEESRPIFRELFQIKEKLIKKAYSNVDLKYLSMGMSQDFEVAIEEGANIIRVGSAIFAGEL